MTELLPVAKKEKLKSLHWLRQEEEEVEVEEIHPLQKHRRNCTFKSLLCFLFYPAGFGHLGLPSDGDSHSSLLPLSFLESEEVLK